MLHPIKIGLLYVLFFQTIINLLLYNTHKGKKVQFIITGFDGIDDDAPKRRMAVREKHIAMGDRLRKEGKALYGVALLDENGNMIGSVYICEFPSRKELDEWLEVEPYVIGNVWKKVDIKQCKVGPSFIDK